MDPIGLKTTTRASFDAVLARIPDLLKAEGFGVLTRIDVQATMKEKLGVAFRRYQILGACNPTLAHEALGIDLAVGVMLPCNVVVHEADDGTTVVTAVDPMQTLAGRDGRFAGVAGKVRERLTRVVAALGAA
jgi:uncharacterized protein (DUF302 family)